MAYNWPSGHKAGTTTTDGATDKISDARADINQNIVNVNEIIDMFDLASEPSNGQIGDLTFVEAPVPKTPAQTLQMLPFQGKGWYSKCAVQMLLHMGKIGWENITHVI